MNFHLSRTSDKMARLANFIAGRVISNEKIRVSKDLPSLTQVSSRGGRRLAFLIFFQYNFEMKSCLRAGFLI